MNIMTQDDTFELDIDAIRESARKHVEDGAYTANYQGNREVIIDQLNAALATEIVCFLRYKRHYFTATSIQSEAIANEFNVHANEEMAHADMIAARIVQLGGEPDYAPETLKSRSHADYAPCLNIDDMIKENLVAERIAIDAYQALINYIDNKDPTTRRMLESILAQEEEHADELSDWIKKSIF